MTFANAITTGSLNAAITAQFMMTSVQFTGVLTVLSKQADSSRAMNKSDYYEKWGWEAALRF